MATHEVREGVPVHRPAYLQILGLPGLGGDPDLPLCRAYARRMHRRARFEAIVTLACSRLRLEAAKILGFPQWVGPRPNQLPRPGLAPVSFSRALERMDLISTRAITCAGPLRSRPARAVSGPVTTGSSRRAAPRDTRAPAAVLAETLAEQGEDVVAAGSARSTAGPVHRTLRQGQRTVRPVGGDAVGHVAKSVAEARVRFRTWCRAPRKLKQDASLEGRVPHPAVV